MEIWGELVSVYLPWRPSGLVVFRPKNEERSHRVVEGLKAKYAHDGRFVVDDSDDNKFWMSRADYFVTDYSEAYNNFYRSAKRPAILMQYNYEAEEPARHEWGWTINRPNQLIPLLEEMDREENRWTASLLKIQKRDMPTLGENFSLIAGMIQRIFNNDDDPTWLRIDKGNTPCETQGDMLKLVAKLVGKSHFNLFCIRKWLDDVQQRVADQQTPKIWLLLLKRALSPSLGVNSPIDYDTPADVARYVDLALNTLLPTLPLMQTIGLLRHCMRKNPQLFVTALLLTITSCHVSGPGKKRALFFLLMEWAQTDGTELAQINTLAEKMPQDFSRPVLNKLNRILPVAMKIPLSLRRYTAWCLGLKKPLAREYWRAHRALS